MSSDRFKFRAWDNINKRYDTDMTMLDRDGDLCYQDCCKYCNGEHPEDFTIEQCTGLKDKNGKLIYEGDVVSFLWQLKDNEVCKIVWDKIHCSFARVDIKTGADFITWYSVFENGQSNRCEIIGNIHEMELEK